MRTRFGVCCLPLKPRKKTEPKLNCEHWCIVQLPPTFQPDHSVGPLRMPKQIVYIVGFENFGKNNAGFTKLASQVLKQKS